MKMKLLLLLLLRRQLRRNNEKYKKKIWMRKIFQDHHSKGEFRLLVNELRLFDLELFSVSFCMSPFTFEELLSWTAPHIIRHFNIVIKRLVSYMIPYVGEFLSERTLVLSHGHSEVGWPVPFLAAFNFPSAATRCPFAAGWTVSKHPTFGLRVRLEPSMFCTAVKHSNHLATHPRTL